MALEKFLTCVSFLKRKFNLRKVVKRYLSNEEENVLAFPDRYNEFKIQMIGLSLHRQLFRYPPYKIPAEKIEKAIKELIRNNLLKNDRVYAENVNFPLPRLHGQTLEEHFYKIGYEFCLPYMNLAFKITKKFPNYIPESFACRSGWTKYYSDGRSEEVDYPTCDVLIFDVETSVTYYSVPVMAVAMSDQYWYTWMSKLLFTQYPLGTVSRFPTQVSYDELIPFGISEKPRLIIGHNIAFDRSYIKEEYLPTPNFTYFLDTMSLHCMMRGYGEVQRSLLREVDSEKSTGEKLEGMLGQGKSVNSWKNQGCFNTLKALSDFYLGVDLKKDPVNIFLDGSLLDIIKKYHEGFLYCSNDVSATHGVFCQLWKIYHSAAPHPATLSGMLMMTKCYLPITERWLNYIDKTDMIYCNYSEELDRIITKIAQQHVSLGMSSSTYRSDPWMKELDWSIVGEFNQDFIEWLGKRTLKPPMRHKRALGNKILREAQKVNDPHILSELTRKTHWFPDLPKNSCYEPGTVLAGYPAWFVNLVKLEPFDKWIGPRPADVQHSHRIVPTLLKLSWSGFPLKYHDKYQWGYLLPKDLVLNGIIDIDGNKIVSGQPTKKYRVMKEDPSYSTPENKSVMSNSLWSKDQLPDDLESQDYMHQRLFGIYPRCEYPEHSVSEEKKAFYNREIREEVMVYEDQGENAFFVPLPHPEGLKKACGNPLGNEYREHLNRGKLVPMTGADGVRFMHLYYAISFWRNNRHRIIRQQFVSFKDYEVPKEFKGENIAIGAIVPRVIPSGTVTRRAVEPTWLTAMNPNPDTVGSELKSAIIAPSNFCFVGADVDSEEMWIAALLADSATVGVHGATPFSFMSIQGEKSQGTDLHTITARSIGINRDDAKILNYGRLYGAGIDFAKNMIKQSQPWLSENEASLRAVYLYNFTKGLRCIELTLKGIELANQKKLNSDKICFLPDFLSLMKNFGIPSERHCDYGRLFWRGGTESEIFNVLEHFSLSHFNMTPILNVSMTRTLCYTVVGEEFLTSRMNWIVQSSAVDFLHLFLLSSFWLFSLLKVPARLVICIHDEIRFMVPIDKRYEAAFACHIANLYTRSAFSQRLGIYDLPQSCAFFSSVDIDKVLRKDPSINCLTPSNPFPVPKIFGDFTCESLNLEDSIIKVGFDIFTEPKLKFLKE